MWASSILTGSQFCFIEPNTRLDFMNFDVIIDTKEIYYISSTIVFLQKIIERKLIIDIDKLKYKLFYIYIRKYNCIYNGARSDQDNLLVKNMC